MIGESEATVALSSNDYRWIYKDRLPKTMLVSRINMEASMVPPISKYKMLQYFSFHQEKA
jgi:hypothetical protein